MKSRSWKEVKERAVPSCSLFGTEYFEWQLA
jgi:hypothetical protein